MILISLCGKINFFPNTTYCVPGNDPPLQQQRNSACCCCKNSEVESKTRELFSTNEFGKLRSRQSNVRGDSLWGTLAPRKFVTWQTNYITQMKCILPYMSKKKKIELYSTLKIS